MHYSKRSFDYATEVPDEVAEKAKAIIEEKGKRLFKIIRRDYFDPARKDYIETADHLVRVCHKVAKIIDSGAEEDLDLDALLGHLVEAGSRIEASVASGVCVMEEGTARFKRLLQRLMKEVSFADETLVKEKVKNEIHKIHEVIAKLN